MAQLRTLKRIDTIIESQFNKGDVIDSRIMQGRILDTYGIKYLPNLTAVARIMGRSKLVAKAASEHDVVEFEVL